MSEPKMVETEPPRTRFSAIEVAPGCWNTTDWPAPIEKLVQLMIALLVPCLIRVLPPWVAIDATPDTTLPPWGVAQAGAVTHPVHSAATATTAKLRHRAPSHCLSATRLRQIPISLTLYRPGHF